MRMHARDVTFGQYARSVELPFVSFFALVPTALIGGIGSFIMSTTGWFKHMSGGHKALLICGAVFLVYHIALLVLLSIECHDQKYYLWDMPWHRWQTWVIMMPLLYLPFGWIVLLKSRRRYNFDVSVGRRIDHDPDIARERDLLDEFHTMDFGVLDGLVDEMLGREYDELDARADLAALVREHEAPYDRGESTVSAVRTDTSALTEKRDYYSSPNAARELYIALRSEAFSRSRDNDLRSIDRKIEQAIDTIALAREQQRLMALKARAARDEFGENDYRYLEAKDSVASWNVTLRTAQQTRNDLEAERNKLVAAQPVAVSERLAREEFEEMMKLPNVRAVQVIDDCVALIVSPRIEYEGDIYDVGDWQLSFGSNGVLRTYLLREGLRKSFYQEGYRAQHPAYRSGSHSFCFDSREQEIAILARNGQFFDAVSVAVGSMHFVNPEDRHKIPTAFKRIKDGTTQPDTDTE